MLDSKINEKIEKIRRVIEERIPSGLIIPQHDQYGHQYLHTPSGKLFRSVTTKTAIIDNERLKRWASRIAVEFIDHNWDRITPKNKDEYFKAAVLAHEDTLKDAGDIGTQGHAVIERYLKRWIETGERPENIQNFIIGTDARLWAITRSAEKFCVDFETIPVASELLVCSTKYGFAGTLDSLMMVKYKGKYIFAIVDWKSSNSIDKFEYCLQVSAYFQAFFEMTGLRPKELLVVRLDKDKMKYEVMKIVDRAAAFRAFKHVSSLYDYINNGYSKMYPFTPKKETFIT